MSQRQPARNEFRGSCNRCGNIHSISPGNTRNYCQQLMDHLKATGTLAFESQSAATREKFSTHSLYGQARGKMFGVMQCMTKDNTIKIIKAFSGQFNSHWLINGWCPPLFDVTALELLTAETEKRIKHLGSKMKNCKVNSVKWRTCKSDRKALSQTLMRDIHHLYQVHNFKGETLGLAELFKQGQGIPTGTGDCCGPKLLNYAAQNDLRPLGMSEFYWGRENRSETRQQSLFYPPCEDKCQPILATMLCGLE